MKLTTSSFLLFTFFCFFTPTYGDSLREIELIDGSTIRAQVLSIDGKTYRLRSETLGELNIPEYRVKAIRTPKVPPYALPQHVNPSQATQSQDDLTSVTSDTAPQIPNSFPATAPSPSDLQRALSQDPAAMNKILSLQNDPLVQEILGDESLMQAINSGNLGPLMNDPRIRALMGHPAVRDLGNQYVR